MSEPFKTKTQLKAEARALKSQTLPAPEQEPATPSVPSVPEVPPPVKQSKGVKRLEVSAPIETVFLSVGKKTQIRPQRRIITSYDLPASRRPIS